MKLVVTALLESVSGIINVLIVLILVWIMFAILGINLLKDKMHFCNFPIELQDNLSIYDYNYEKVFYFIKKQCLQLEGAIWDNRDMNMDHILRAMVTLFVLSTLEGWPDYMYDFIDAGDDQFTGPIKDNNPYMFFYFMIFIFIGALFLINLIIGVLFLNYRIAEQLAKNK